MLVYQRALPHIMVRYLKFPTPLRSCYIVGLISEHDWDGGKLKDSIETEDTEKPKEKPSWLIRAWVGWVSGGFAWL